ERLLAERGLKLDAAVELKVDEERLVDRIETRTAETRAKGAELRSDDNPEVLKQRLSAYRKQTAPLIEHYRQKGLLKRVDGMRAIAEVAAAIDRVLGAPVQAPG
ncbi:MAG TPA: nucleoside monophosphate kinase, partial [Xanthobacteraceae bacterium]|nr:nucleoside monophosphate kinase [Xanthobacteraceae bacterium]